MAYPRENLRLEYLPRDLDTLILPYSLYDTNLSPRSREQLLENLDTPTLAPLRRIYFKNARETRAKLLYRSEFATNDIFANKFIDCYGNIEWSVAYRQANILMIDRTPVAKFFDSNYIMSHNNDGYNDWDIARNNNFDSLQIRIIDKLFSNGVESLLQTARQLMFELDEANLEYERRLASFEDNPIPKRVFMLERKLWINRYFLNSYVDETTDEDFADDDYTEEELSRPAIPTPRIPSMQNIIDKMVVRPIYTSSSWRRFILLLFSHIISKQILKDERIGRFVVGLITDSTGITITHLPDTTAVYMPYCVYKQLLLEGLTVEDNLIRLAAIFTDDVNEVTWVLQQNYPSSDIIAIKTKLLQLLGSAVSPNLYIKYDLSNLYNYYLNNADDRDGQTFSSQFNDYSVWYNAQYATTFELLNILVMREGLKFFSLASTQYYYTLRQGNFLVALFRRLPTVLLLNSIDYNYFKGPGRLISLLFRLENFSIQPSVDIRRIYYPWQGSREKDSITMYVNQDPFLYYSLQEADDVNLTISDYAARPIAVSLPVLRVLLPYERVNEAKFRQYLSYFFATFSNPKYTTATMYILFVKYYYLVNKQPVVPYQYNITNAANVHKFAGTMSKSETATICSFAPIGHTRMLVVLKEQTRPVVSGEITPHAVDEKIVNSPDVDYEGFVPFTHYIYILPAHTSGSIIFPDDNPYFILFDYDISDVDWLLNQRK